MEQNAELVKMLMDALRIKSQIASGEVSGLLAACLKDLEIAGVCITDTDDPLFRQAAKLYCKAGYGYDKDSEKFRAAYAALKDAMALSGDYREGGDADGGRSSSSGVGKHEG